MKKPSERIDPRYLRALWRVPLEVVTDEMAVNVYRTGWLLFAHNSPPIYEWGVSVTHEMLHRVHRRHQSNGWIEAKAQALMRNPRWVARVYERIAFICARDLLVLTPDRVKGWNQKVRRD